MNDTIFDLEEIKYKLKFISDTDDEAFYMLLTGIIKPTATGYLNKVILTRNRFKKEFKDFKNDAFDYDCWGVRRNRIDFSLLEIFDELESEYLKDDCETILEVFINGHKDTESPEVAEPTETFSFPESTQDIVIPDTKELIDAERQQYKRLLIQCQDDIAIQAYESAYSHCNKAREAIEPESAQLYEYLLLTYIKKEGIEKIVQETIKGDKTKFDQVLLFIQRCKKYQHSSKPKCPSKTLDTNLKEIAKDFALCLRIEYRRIKSDWVIHTEGVTFSEEKKTVQNIMVLFERIYTRIHKVEFFLSEVYFEICGAGKFQWIKLDKNNKPYNATSSFDALGKKKLIEKELENNFLQDFKRTEKTPDNVFSVKVYYALWSKYMELRAKVKSKNRKLGVFNNAHEAQQQIIKCFESFKTAYNLFKDTRFLEIPLKEFSKEGLFIWFKYGETINFVNKEVWGYDALTEYEYYKKEKNDIVFSNKIDNDNEEKIAIALTHQTDEDYKKIFQKGKSNYSVYERERQNIYTCLQNWFKAYRAFPQPMVIHSIMNEIMGNGLLVWFDSNANGFVFKKWMNNTQSDIVTVESLLAEMFEWHSDNTIEGFDWHLIQKEISKKFFGTLKNRYDEEKSNYQPLVRCLKDLEIASNCYLWYPQEDYLSFVINRIWGDKLYQCINLNNNGILETIYQNQQQDFEPYSAIEAFCFKVNYPSAKEKIINLLGDRFFDNALYHYERIYSNDSPVNRQYVINFILTCKQCYLLSQNHKYLVPAIHELQGNKFKWINHFPLIGRVNISRGKINGFDAIQTLNEFSIILNGY